MIIESLNIIFVFLTSIIVIYLIRHYIFTLTVLRKSNNRKLPPNNAVKLSFEPTVTILIPAHNEEHVIGKMLDKITKLSYPKTKLQVIMIDDASSDATGKIGDEYAKFYGFVKVLHRDSRIGGIGKAAALNAGLKEATGEIVLCFDADYLPNSDIVEKLVEKFADSNVGAVQGRPVVWNEPHNILTRLIALERIGGYRVDQEARELLGLMPQFGGTVGGFRRSIVDSLGGFDESMVTEDTDLTVQIYLLGYKIRYVGDAECYEEAVDTLKRVLEAKAQMGKRAYAGLLQECIKSFEKQKNEPQRES